jgi:hypothetical protein
VKKTRQIKNPGRIGMKRALAFVTIIFAGTVFAGTESLAQYLTGAAREDFIRGTTKSCMQTKPNSKETRDVPDSLFEGNCRCYANALAEKIAAADMRNPAVTEPITKAAAAACYRNMKAEALGLYKAGQYPKQ